MGFCADGCRPEAWKQEFWPSTAADAILGVITGGVTRAGWLPAAHQRRAYLAAVPQASVQINLPRKSI